MTIVRVGGNIARYGGAMARLGRLIKEKEPYIPIMTSNTAPAPFVATGYSSSGLGDGDYYFPWKGTTEDFAALVLNSGNPGAWINISFTEEIYIWQWHFDFVYSRNGGGQTSGILKLYDGSDYELDSYVINAGTHIHDRLITTQTSPSNSYKMSFTFTGTEGENVTAGFYAHQIYAYR